MTEFIEPIFAQVENVKKSLSDVENDKFIDLVNKFSILILNSSECSREICLNVFHCSNNRESAKKCLKKTIKDEVVINRSAYLCSKEIILQI